MAVTEETRHRMHVKFEEVVGAEVATTLMEHLPPVGWADVATRRDLDQLEIRLRAAIALQGSELRAEMAALGSELRAEMAAQGSHLLLEMEKLRTDVRAQISSSTWKLLGAMGTMLTISTAVGRIH